ncbi:DNA translocase FtsK [Acholeplasma equirhinis]|uniref:DNA translocase FtsK n=1 Tax=Acholeplasma equirhinis TaxID=555393 RepID=UPI00197B0377|nr:DNA translocase FtsK [Acholeplasma equirhinis]MBN3490676.1 DNA translocase FtsK [Acholeplasma equirhinis]
MKKLKNKDQIKEVFTIPQIPKIDGIRGAHKYVKERFVSPLFGSDVKDEISVPFAVHVIGDKVKKYDAFRTKPQMDQDAIEKKTGTKYYEFTDQVISKETRKQVFGVDTYQKSETKYEAPVEEPKKIEPIVEEADEMEFQPKPVIEQARVLPPWMKTRSIEMDAEDEDLQIETHKRDDKEIKVKSSFGMDKDEDIEVPFESVPMKSAPREVKTKPYASSASNLTTRNYQYPPLSIFKKTTRNSDEKPQWLLDQIDIINRTLNDHAVDGEVAGSKKGPTVTRYEISLEPGVPVKRVTAIQDNIMMNLAAKTLRIEAPIPGKPFVGIEVPNQVADIVSFGNVVDREEFLNDHEHPLKVALGEDIDGTNIYVDIAKMPHGLIAGGTGSGKSVCVNTILVSLLLKNKPEDLKLILIDPKMVELTPYNDLPHLITPVITDPKMAATALNWVVDEMENRYKKFADSRSRDIKSYNENIKKGFVDDEKMPLIVIVIDELADLMMVAAHDVEDAIQRITQKARAAGIHLLVATQRPTVDVIRGTIKSNIPTRIAFRVSSFTDSTTILDGAGAEQLLGRGDMLLKETERPIRLQGAFISNNEIDQVIDYIKAQSQANYILRHEDLRVKVTAKEIINDDLFADIAYFVVREGNCSINNIQKQFEIGFNRAQKIVSLLETYQIVSPTQGTKAREVLVDFDELEKILKEAGII